MAFGRLYVVATPIGNLSDLSSRAVSILKECDYVLSEDTRETQKLFNHLKFSKSQVSYRDQNHDKVFLPILNDLLHGKTLCLVSDNGTPLISDPGYKLISSLRKNNFNAIYSVPGPSALTSALSISGLPTDKFLFAGFLPKKDTDIIKALEKLKPFDGTLVFYESPLRLKSLVNTLLNVLGNRYASICAEMTKINESVVTGELAKIANDLTDETPRGEYVVVVAKEGFSYD